MFDYSFLILVPIVAVVLWMLFRPIKRQTYRSHDEGDMH